MASLKALKSVFLKFAFDSPCAGLYLVQRLTSPRMRKSNPECKVDFQVVPSGGDALLKMVFADGKEEELDISKMHAEKVYGHIASRIEERAMTEVLTQNNFVGKKLTSSWGV